MGHEDCAAIGPCAVIGSVSIDAGDVSNIYPVDLGLLPWLVLRHIYRDCTAVMSCRDGVLLGASGIGAT